MDLRASAIRPASAFVPLVRDDETIQLDRHGPARRALAMTAGLKTRRKAGYTFSHSPGLRTWTV